MFLFYRFVFVLSVFLAGESALHAQSASLDYFEFNVEPNDDSTLNKIYYVVALSHTDQINNLSFVVKNEQGSTVTQLNSSIALLKSTYPHRVENGILYLTIETGAYAPSLYYEATATLTPLSGEAIEYTRMKQM